MVRDKGANGGRSQLCLAITDTRGKKRQICACAWRTGGSKKQSVRARTPKCLAAPNAAFLLEMACVIRSLLSTLTNYQY